MMSQYPTIAQLPDLIAALPAAQAAIAERLLFVERVQGHTTVPPAMHDWLRRYFGDPQRVTEQTIVRVTNRQTLDTALYNPLRALRPHDDGGDGDADLEAILASFAGPGNVFADPLQMTTADPFGRIRGEYCVTASNVAKYDGWHGLVIFDEFHPLRFDWRQFRDYFSVAMRWLRTAHQLDPAARYPLITWNCLWKAGASLTHGHLQMTLSHGMACGIIERWRRAAVAYGEQHTTGYCADLATLHAALGLGFSTDPAVSGFATLTPIKDRELVLFSSPAPAADWPGDLTALWQSAYTALRGLIDDQGVRSFNLAFYLPPLSATAEPWHALPPLIRIVDRGNPLPRSVNFGAMELFAASVITADPFAVAARLRNSV